MASRLRQLAFGALATAASAGIAAAQAGGGGSYSPGGGGGGGGGDGDGLFWIFYMLIRLAIEAPVIGVPLLIVAGVLAYKGFLSGKSAHRSRVIRGGRGARGAMRSQAVAGALQAADAAFDEATFLQRVRRAFRTVQDAWCAQDLRPIRPFVSDGVHERFSLQIAEQRQDGWRQGMEGTSIGSVRLIHAQADAHFDTVTVEIVFSADIHRVSRQSGEKIRGSTLPRAEFVECWSFLRRRGAKTTGRDGLMEGTCPNCAAPLELNRAEECSACGALVSSGQHDWVLAEITQASEWRGEDTARVPGLAALRAKDPELNVQHLEDRASVMFWRKAAADRDGDVKPLVKVADAALLAEYRERVTAGPDGFRTWLGDCAVGSVKTLGLLAGDARDRAVMEVRWDGRRHTISGDGERSADPDRTLRRSLFVLSREAGATSDIGMALSSSHCPSCGAPEAGGPEPVCGFCGIPLNDGAHGWVLGRICAANSGEGLQLLAEIREPALGPASGQVAAAAPSRAEVLEWVVVAALEDGRIDDDESATLQAMAARLAVPRMKLHEIVADARSGQEALVRPEGPAEARRWMELLASVMLEDGNVSAGEKRLLQSAASRCGWTAVDVTMLLRRQQTALHRETRAARRS